MAKKARIRSFPLRLALAAMFFALIAPPDPAQADSPDDSATQIARLEQQVAALSSEVQNLRANQQQSDDEHREALLDILQDMSDSGMLETRQDRWSDRLHFGSYGEIHANFNNGEAGENQMDIHRLVLYLGYDFADWIRLNSEIEIEHAYVSNGSGGEVIIEQLFFDFALRPEINARVGRVLTPMGITNQNHEPTEIFGVERPSFDKYIIPTTWSSDGIGVYGQLAPWMSYEAYIVGGLDGSGFSSTNGIRDGRIKERPALSDIAMTGRMDFRPFIGRELPYNQRLRLGVSGYWGGVDNGNKGRNPGIDGSIQIYSADFSYSISRFDFHGAMAYQAIDGAEEIGNNVASGIFGWYLEAGYHFMPDSWRTGRLENADALVFARYDYFNTQFDMPSGVSADPAGERSEWTFGINFYPVPNLVLKADYQYRTNEGDDPAENRINFGIGWTF
jgi:hypothetical protein